MKNNEVVIIGGGLAGLTAAIHLSKTGIRVTVIEKNEYPKHKVCGEYISNEVLPYFTWLGIDISALHPKNIKRLQFSTLDGKTLNCPLPLGGFGISRFALDEFLYKKALGAGCRFIHGIAESVTFYADEFTITASGNEPIRSKIVLGAFGKRSNIDQKLYRNFIFRKSPWLAVKAHYSGDFPDDLVGLHNFKGGYCGISRVEGNAINVCYLSDYKNFKKYRNITDYQDSILSKNPNLKAIFENFELQFGKPITISQISFEKKKAVEGNIIMIGDSAGLIHPLCGNGMAIAIHNAKIASELVQEFYSGTIRSRGELEKKYTRLWNRHFRSRIKIGRLLANVLQRPGISRILIRIFVMMPWLLKSVIKHTHGKPIFTEHDPGQYKKQN